MIQIMAECQIDKQLNWTDLNTFKSFKHTVCLRVAWRWHRFSAAVSGPAGNCQSADAQFRRWWPWSTGDARRPTNICPYSVAVKFCTKRLLVKRRRVNCLHWMRCHLWNTRTFPPSSYKLSRNQGASYQKGAGGRVAEGHERLGVRRWR